MFRFANIHMLYAFILIPVFVLVYILITRFRKRDLKKFGDMQVIEQLMPDVSTTRPVLKFIIFLLALVFVIIGLARPQFGSKLQEVKHKGIELIIALDVSNSMNAQDIQPSRLERAKQAISKLVDRLDNDKIGLIVFAGEAYTQIPITTDYVSVKMFLSGINTGIVPVQGTAIGSAIDLADRSFTTETGLKKVLIIITDGENHEDDPVALATQAAEKGIIIHTIGIGSPQGSPIPITKGTQDFRKDREGNVIMSKLDETTLQKIATSGGGIYVRANNSQFGLNTILDNINKMEKKEFKSKIYSDYNDHFQLFFGIAFALILLDYVILERKNKKLKGINLFDINNFTSVKVK